MGAYKHIWVHTDIYGCKEAFIRCIQSYMGTIHMVAYKEIWVNTDIYGCIEAFIRCIEAIIGAKRHL